MSCGANVVKECGEEAGIPPALAGRARPAGCVSYAGMTPDGLKRDVLFVYDLLLPSDFKPVPQVMALLMGDLPHTRAHTCAQGGLEGAALTWFCRLPTVWSSHDLPCDSNSLTRTFTRTSGQKLLMKCTHNILGQEQADVVSSLDG